MNIERLKSAIRSAITSHPKLLGILTIAIIFFALIFWLSQSRKPTQKSVRVKQGNLSQILTVSGSIDAQEKVGLTFQSPGRLSYVGVKEGDRVRRGQLIASLDSRSVKKNLQKELNVYAKQRNTFDQTRDDNETVLNDTIKRLLENTQYDLNNAVLDVELQSLALEYSHITSPIAGIVTRVDTPYTGVNITPASTVFEIINPQTLFFLASVDQIEVPLIHQAMQATIAIDSFPDQKLHGVVSTISYIPKSNETGTVYEVKLTFTPLSDAIYRVGMTGDANFVIKEVDRAIYIPILYLHENQDGKPYVNIMKNGKIQKKYVTTGVETDEFVQITKGLKKGDHVYD